MKAREPQQHENPKTTLFVTGQKTSQILKLATADLATQLRRLDEVRVAVARVRAESAGTRARVHDLRNRVAHHEPIFHTNVAQHFADLTFIAGYVDAQAPQWLWETSRVHALMVSRPGRP